MSDPYTPPRSQAPDGGGGAAGLFGKIPAYGDFVWRGLPRSFVDPWVRCLTALLDQGAATFGGGWSETYLSSPLWRFALTPGLCGPAAWAGVLLASLDRIGRSFPITLACPLPIGVDTARLTRTWSGFTAMETHALALLDQTLDLDDVLPPLAHLPATVPAGAEARVTPARAGQSAGWWLAGPVEELPPDALEVGLLRAAFDGAMPSASLWWQHGWNDLPAAALLFRGLPLPAAATALFAVR